jgi:hypothetical protein
MQKVSKTPSQQITWVWWCVPVTPNVWEALAGRSMSKDSLGKNKRPYLKEN